MALYRGPEAPVLLAPSRRRPIAKLGSARSCVHGLPAPRATSVPPGRPWGAILRGAGHGTIIWSEGRLAIVPLLLRPCQRFLVLCHSASKLWEPWRRNSTRAGHQATAPRAPLNEYEHMKALTHQGLGRRPPGARSEICLSSVVLGRPRSTLF
jgi:hypothetical protein